MKRKKTKSPTARTLEECRKRGWIAGVVEQTIPHTFIKRDLFGCIDVVAIVPRATSHECHEGCTACRGGIMGIQATSHNGGNHAARRRKIEAEPRMAEWCKHAQLAIWSWSKRGGRWQLREEAVVI